MFDHRMLSKIYELKQDKVTKQVIRIWCNEEIKVCTRWVDYWFVEQGKQLFQQLDCERD